VRLLRVRSVGNAPRSLQRLNVEKPQGTQMVGHRARRQLLDCEQLGLVFPNMSRAEAIGRAVEVLCESFDRTEILACGSF